MPGQGIFDREDKLSINLAKIKKNGKNFEVVIDADQAVLFKEGKVADIKDVLKSEKIFRDAKKGEDASENLLREVFGTDDELKIAEIIITDGQIQLTAEFRKKIREKKFRQIVDIIHRNCVDPRTHLPHPVNRIENAMNEAKVKIDEFKNAQEQIPEVMNALRPILPLKSEINEIAIRISSEYALKAYSTVKSNSIILKEEWQKDGSWVVVIEIPAGLREELFSKLNKLTKGDLQTKILKTR